MIQVRAVVKFRAFGITFGTVDTGYVPIPLPAAAIVATQLIPAEDREIFNERGVQLYLRIRKG